VFSHEAVRYQPFLNARPLALALLLLSNENAPEEKLPGSREKAIHTYLLRYDRACSKAGFFAVM
jgi:hypothetical protein